VEQLMADRRTDDWTKVITYDDICHIARHQIDEIKTLSGEAGLSVKRSFSETVFQAKPVFFDTELITTKVWFDYAFHTVPAWLEEAIRQYPMDIYLLTYPDLPWVPDPARSNGSDAIRMELFERYEAEIQALNIPYYVIQHNEK
jgi:nicotinamide riboside kinase